MEGLDRDPPLIARSQSRRPSSPLVIGALLTACAVAIGLTAALFSQGSQALLVLSRDARRSIAITPQNDQEFVALDDLATMFQLNVREDVGAITVTYKGKTIVLTPDQALASISGRLISLPAAPVRTGGRRWLVPVEFISRAFALVSDVRIELRKPSHLLIVGDLRVPRIRVTYEPLGAAARLTVDATPRANSTVSQDGNHLALRFDADALDSPDTLLQPPPQGFVQSVRLLDAVTVGVDLTPRFAAFKATSQPLDSTMRVVIDLVGAQTETAAGPPAATNAAGAATTAPPAPPELGALTLPPPSIHTIALDPGHGGEDEGARGTDGTKEKDVTLALARRVKAIIEARLGIRVLLTRDDDRNVALDARAASANSNKADVFISLHANASFRKTLSGASVFSAAFPPSAEAAAAAVSIERLPTFGGGTRAIELLPWRLAQAPFIDRSVELAEIIGQQFQNRVPLSPKPVDRAPLRVLEAANMPAVLIEAGYLTNPDQEKQLLTNEFQNAFVQALYDAVLKFREVVEGGPRPAAGGGQ